MGAFCVTADLPLKLPTHDTLRHYTPCDGRLKACGGNEAGHKGHIKNKKQTTSTQYTGWCSEASYVSKTFTLRTTIVTLLYHKSDITVLSCTESRPNPLKFISPRRLLWELRAQINIFYSVCYPSCLFLRIHVLYVDVHAFFSFLCKIHTLFHAAQSFFTVCIPVLPISLLHSFHSSAVFTYLIRRVNLWLT